MQAGDGHADRVRAVHYDAPQVLDGRRVLSHWHPQTERLTVIQGVVHLGTGDRFDAGATQALKAGTYSAMPPRMTHLPGCRARRSCS